MMLPAVEGNGFFFNYKTSLTVNLRYVCSLWWSLKSSRRQRRLTLKNWGAEEKGGGARGGGYYSVWINF